MMQQHKTGTCTSGYTVVAVISTSSKRKGLLCLELILFNGAQKFNQRLCNVIAFNAAVRKIELDTSVLGNSDILVCTFQVGPKKNLLMYVAGQCGMVT